MSFSCLADLEQALFHCALCPLRQSALGPTSYNGSPDSPLVLVGEGPGGVDDEFGVPLVGPSGQLLDKALWSVHITRDRVYTTNVIKCRPQNNRTPTLDEGRFCAHHWLDLELAFPHPKVIIALGNVALQYLFGPDACISKHRGQWFKTKYGVEAIATYHPAYLLRLSGQELFDAKWQVFYDLKAAVEKCAQLAPDYIFRSPEKPDLLAQFQTRRQLRQLNRPTTS
jgi:DNA polymerase